MIELASWYFLLLIPLVIYLFFRKQKKSALKFSSVKLLKASAKKDAFKHKLGKFLTVAGLIFLIFALTRPQLQKETIPIDQKGIDIAIALDISSSMSSVDFEPNRLEVARETINEFIRGRTNDRISLIIFAGTAHTRIPLTLDHDILTQSLNEVSFDSLNRDGTAIGMAISVGLNRLKKSDSDSKIIILLTDGDNNAGEINPYTASQLAQDMGVKIYTIGVGSDRTIVEVTDIFGRVRRQAYEGGFDEELLKQIAQDTGGQYFRAKDPKALVQIFETIDRLEKSEFERDDFIQYMELYVVFAITGLVLLLLGIFFDKYYYTKIP